MFGDREERDKGLILVRRIESSVSSGDSSDFQRNQSNAPKNSIQAGVVLASGRGGRALTPSCLALIKKSKTVERDSAVDIAKGLGILLVIFGHTVAAWGGNQEALHRFIYAFHMPLFFGVAGLYLSPSTSLLSLARNKLSDS